MATTRPGKGIRLRAFLDPDANVMDIATKEGHVVSVLEDTSIADMLSLMLNRGLRRIPVTDHGGNLKGIVSTTDILSFLGAGEKNSVYQRLSSRELDIPVKEIMETQVRTLDKRTNIRHAVRMMRYHGVGALPVLDRRKLVGIVTEKDIIDLFKGKLSTTVENAMISKPFFVRSTYPIIDVAKIMVNGPYRRLPVVDGGICVGVVTPSDILKYLNRNKRLRWLKRTSAHVKRAMNQNIVVAKSYQKVHDAVRIMQTHKVGGLPVVRGNEMDIVGIITERDIIDMIILFPDGQ